MNKLKNHVIEMLEQNEYVKLDKSNLRLNEIQFLDDEFIISENNDSIYITRDDNFYHITEHGTIVIQEHAEEVLETLDLRELFIETHKKALQYSINGTMSAFLDLRDLTVGYEFMESGRYNHEVDDYYKLFLYDVETPNEIFDDVEVDVNNIEKVDEYLTDLSWDFDLDWDKVGINLDEIYEG